MKTYLHILTYFAEFFPNNAQILENVLGLFTVIALVHASGTKKYITN